jgi:hypothetical protein
VLGKQVPVIVAYVSAFYVKRHHGSLCDCNVDQCGQTDGKPNDLCHFGAAYIQQDVAKIVEVYKNYAQGYAACYGTTRPIIFEMEPDWYQYIASTQGDPMTKTEAGTILGQYAAAIKQHLPNAYLSIDISPWIDDNGATNGKDWYSHFDLTQFTFANTSGGNTLARCEPGDRQGRVGRHRLRRGRRFGWPRRELGRRHRPERPHRRRRRLDQPIQSQGGLGHHDQDHPQPTEDSKILSVVCAALRCARTD